MIAEKIKKMKELIDKAQDIENKIKKLEEELRILSDVRKSKDWRYAIEFCETKFWTYRVDVNFDCIDFEKAILQKQQQKDSLIKELKEL